MHARVTTIQANPERLDEMVSSFEEDDLPKIRGLDGFRGFTMLIDRSSGRAIGTSYCSSEEAMAASEEAVQSSRRRAADTGGASDEPRVERYEVALDTFVKQ